MTEMHGQGESATGHGQGGEHWHKPMRRRDREIQELSEIHALLERGKVMTMGLAQGNTPLVVPVYYAFLDGFVYFHSAGQGTKIAWLKQNPQVSFVVTHHEGVIDAELPCDFEAKHQTVVGFGTAVFVDDLEEKKKALDKIVGHFSERKFEYGAERLKNTTVVRIELSALKGKKHGY